MCDTNIWRRRRDENMKIKLINRISFASLSPSFQSQSQGHGTAVTLLQPKIHYDILNCNTFFAVSYSTVALCKIPRQSNFVRPKVNRWMLREQERQLRGEKVCANNGNGGGDVTWTVSDIYTPSHLRCHRRLLLGVGVVLVVSPCIRSIMEIMRLFRN